MRNIFILLVTLLSGYNVFAQNINRKLYEAVSAADTVNVNYLLNNGADANYKEKIGSFGMSMLILAVNNQDFATIKLLITHKVNIDERDWFNSTALMYAAHSGNLDIIKCLIKNGADIHADDGQGNTVLSAAKEGKHQEAIQLIQDLLK